MRMNHAAPGYSAEFVISSPNTGSNYCIGCVTDGKYISKIPQCCGRGGSFESLGQLRTDIPSLYESQKLARTSATTTPQATSTDGPTTASSTTPTTTSTTPSTPTSTSTATMTSTTTSTTTSMTTSTSTTTSSTATTSTT